MKANNVEIGSMYNSYMIISEPILVNGYKKIKVRCKCGLEKMTYCGNLKRLNKCKKCLGIDKYRKYKKGDKINHLTVLDYVYTKNKKKSSMILVQCDCGNTRKLTASDFSKNKTCGCNRFIQGKEHQSFAGYNNISLTKFNQYKNNAIRRNIEFSVTIEYLDYLYLSQDKKCALSKLDICFGSSKQHSTASLDRINSSKGYIEGNVQWVHKNINRMKSDFSEEYFIYICKLISENSFK